MLFQRLKTPGLGQNSYVFACGDGLAVVVDPRRDVGLALLGYCPGTGVAALGQGNYDAIAGILGLMAGSYFYAETSHYLGSTIESIGNRGGIMLPDLLGMRLAVFLAVFVPLLVLTLFCVALLAP